MSPKTLAKLKDAWTFVEAEHRKGTAPELVILAMIKLFGAKRWDADYAGHKLRCGTVTASCTTSRDSGLLRAWQRLAGMKLQAEKGQ